MTAKPFELTLEDGAASAAPHYLSLSGFLDAHTVADFDSAAQRITGSARSELILDLQSLNYISSAGIGSIMALLQQLRRRGGDMIVLQPAPKVLQVLELLGFTEIFQIVETRAQAAELLAARKES